MRMPLVTVIIPNYNHAKYLRQRIDTVLNNSGVLPTKAI